MFNNLLASLNRWLGWRVGLKPTDIICVDIDAVAALEPRRAERNKTLDTMQSISTNENDWLWAMSLLMVAMYCWLIAD